MNIINNYKDFILEKEFNSILEELFKIVESEGKWIDDRTIVWDFTNKEEETEKKDWIDKSIDKIEEFISKLPKEKIKSYFIRLMNGIKTLPDIIRKRLIAGYLSAFLAIVGFGYLMTDTSDAENLDPKIKKELVEINSNKEEVNTETIETTKKASFEEAQKLVKTAEAGYSDDRGDNGNYIDVPGGKRFIGTNHGISAPILDKYFKKQGIKRLLTKEDMINLSYKTALKIYKSDYWDAQHLGELSDQNVANVIYDGCVNQGTDAMRSIVRDALEENGVEISDNDIIFSKEILTKANSVNQVDLFNSIKKYRELRYKESDTFSRHGEGWLNRLDNITYVSQETISNRV